MAPAAALLLACAAATAEAGLTDLDRRVEASLPATRAEGPVLVHYDPASLSEGWARKEGERALAALRLLERRLGVTWEGTAHVFLHRDAESFRMATGAPPEWEAFASGRRSMHLPRGAPMVHEMTHLVVHGFPGCEGRDPGGLLREGLAAAMEIEDRGVPVVSSASVYARLGLLPPLADLRDRWPSGPPRGAHPYHAAGAFVAWLLETRGVETVKALYADPGSAERRLGSSWGRIEAEWVAWLMERPVPEAEEEAVRRGLGLPSARIPDSLLRGRATALPGGTPADWREGRAGSWIAAEGGGLRGESGEDWAILQTTRRFPAEAALRLRVRATGEASVLLRLHRVQGGCDDVLLTPRGCLVALRGGEGGFAGTEVRLVPGRWTEVLLQGYEGVARLYLDGRLVREVERAFSGEEGAVGLGVRGGVVEVSEAAVVEPR